MATQALSITLPALLRPAHHPDNRLALDHYIEALIHLSEQLDGDPELEPSLGWSEDGPGSNDRALAEAVDLGRHRSHDCDGFGGSTAFSSDLGTSQ